MKPDGTPFSITLLVEGDQRPVMTRAGTMIVQQWRQFGIDAKARRPIPRDFFPRVEIGRLRGGDRLERRKTWGGAPRPLASSSIAGTRNSLKPRGERQPPRNRQRWKNCRARQDHRADPHHRFR